MSIKDEDVVKNVDESGIDDDFSDIYDEANPDDKIEEDESALKARDKFQKFIKKISSPSQ